MTSDRVSELYHGRIFDKHNQETCRKRIHWLCSRATGEDVLDFGCSQGIASLLLGREGRRVVGVDVDPASLEYARRELEQESEEVRSRVRFEEVNGGPLKFADHTFDSVLFGEVIEHLREPASVLAELRRVLKPGGRLLASTPFGVLPHDDHMHTFYLTNFVEMIRPHFAIVELEILDKYICCTAMALGDEATNADILTAESMLDRSEEAFERAEWAHIEWRKNLRRQYQLRVKDIDKLKKKHALAMASTRRSHQNAIARIQSRQAAICERMNRTLLNRIERQREQMEYYKSTLLLRENEVRYRLGDAIVRTFYRPAEVLRLPTRVARLFLEGLQRRRKRLAIDETQGDPGLAAAMKSSGIRVLGEASRQHAALENPFSRLKRPTRFPVKAAVIMDEFTIECFRDECRMIPVTPGNWEAVLSADRPDMLFVESTWKGNDGAWRYKVNRTEYKDEDDLPRLAHWCKNRKIPTVFWNKEDPPNFDRFIKAAALFDHVFTTDEDCIPKYREQLGHDRIAALPFAAQPSFHNPINCRDARQGRLCFAGTYHREKYPQRQQDLEMLLRPAKTRGLTIYDRQHGYGQEDRYSFPVEYQPMVKGGLAYLEMVEAYKAYDVFLNINSVRESPTMFSRRVLELLACGTAVISTPSKGMELMLGRDAVAVAETEEEAATWMDRLLGDPDLRDRMVARGQRRVFTEHTYEQRFQRILDAIGLPYSRPSRRVCVITVTNRPAFLENALANYRRQHYDDKEWIVVLNSDDFNLEQVRQQLADVPDVRVLQRPESSTLGACLNVAVGETDADYVAKFDDDDYYGEHYLTDSVNAFLYGGSDIVGKHAYYAFLEGRNCLALRFEQHEHRYVRFVSGATMLIRRSLLDEQRFPEDVRRGMDTKFQEACSEQGYGIYSADRFNFVANRQKSAANHTWQISDDDILKHSRIIDCAGDHLKYISV